MIAKKILALLLVGVMAFAFAACGGGSASTASTDSTATTDTEAETTPESTNDDSTAQTTDDGKTYKVAFVTKSLSDQFFILMKVGAENAAAEMGNVELTFIAPNSESDVQAQVDMIQNLVGQGVDAICVAPSSQDAVIPVFEQAHAAGIKILAVDTDTTFENKITFIGTGNTAAAQKGGEYVVEKLGEGKNAIILRGRLGDKTHDEREAGWKDSLEAAGYNILEIQAADSEAEKAMNITQNLLTKYDNIDVIVTTADSMAQGAQRAVEAANKEIPIMGFDGTVPVSELTAEGKFLGTVAQDPYNMGVIGVQEAVKAIKGETVEERIDTGAIIVGQDNATDFLNDLNSKLGQ